MIVCQTTLEIQKKKWVKTESRIKWWKYKKGEC